MLDEKVFQEDLLLSFYKKILTSHDLSAEQFSVLHIDSTLFANQYYLSTVMEFLIKYQILHKGEGDLLFFANGLQNIFEKYLDYQEFLVEANRLLVFTIEKKLNLGDHLSKENKQKILEYAYHNYIEEGYCFYPFPSSMVDKVKKDGLLIETIPFEEEMQKVEEIFENHQVKEIFGQSTSSIPKEYFSLTDSPSMAYFYSTKEPFYFYRFIGNTMEDAVDDRYEKGDQVACATQVEQFCNKKNLTEAEKATVMGYFNKMWEFYDLSSIKPCVAMIPRKVIGRDHLEDYQEIIDGCEERDIIYSLSQIMDSRYMMDHRYTKVLPKDFTVVTFPSFKTILSYEKKDPIVDLPPEEKTAPEVKVLEVTKNDHGYASVVALLGLFFIALGCTWLFISLYFGLH